MFKIGQDLFAGIKRQFLIFFRLFSSALAMRAQKEDNDRKEL